MNKHWRKADIDSTDILTIEGEPFFQEILGGKTVLRHRQWSLMGSGSTRAEACASLREEAEDISDFYFSKPDETLTIEAVALKYFLQRLLA